MALRNGRLGEEVHENLVRLGIETPMMHPAPGSATRRQKVLECARELVKALGLDITDDSLMETPSRIATMYCDEVFYGLNYETFPECTNINNAMGYTELISQKCSVMSLCEHHFVPFTGVAHVGYIPDKKVLGLSKLNRVVDFFCRRPQVQERLTVQVCATLQYILGTEDVAVVITAEHFCVKLRGVKDEQSNTVTSRMGGKFLSVPPLRQEFLALTR